MLSAQRLHLCLVFIPTLLRGSPTDAYLRDGKGCSPQDGARSREAILSRHRRNAEEQGGPVPDPVTRTYFQEASKGRPSHSRGTESCKKVDNDLEKDTV